MWLRNVKRPDEGVEAESEPCLFPIADYTSCNLRWETDKVMMPL